MGIPERADAGDRAARRDRGSRLRPPDDQLTPELPRRTRRLLSQFGPGIITGAADDDPSGIATYTVVGARFGTSLLWTVLLTWPLMAAVQMMCARVGMVTGAGLIDALRHRFSRPVILLFVLSLLLANTINVGADLVGMADAAELFTGLDSHIWVVLFGIATAWATIRLRYSQIARTLKWLTLVLLAYLVAAFQVGPDWGAVLRATVLPTFPEGSAQWAGLVAILGTTISPYLFFWQASQEVEEEKALGRRGRDAASVRRLKNSGPARRISAWARCSPTSSCISSS